MSKYSSKNVTDVSIRAAEYGRQRKKKKRLRTVVTYLAAIVVFCTVYALILPAITKERDAFCGFEEHVHTDECYTVTVPLCEICGNPVTTGADDGSLSYEDSAVSTDTATADDSVTQGEDTGQPDTEEPPSEETSPEEKTSDETQEENKADTSPDAESGNAEENTSETAPEADHVHKIPEGFVEKILTCEKEEHTHTDICYSDKDADVEDESVWLSTIPEDLPTDWSASLIEVAKSQLGYTESTTNFTVGENGERHGYNRYSAWFGEPYKDFEETFVMFCMHYAGFDEEYFPTSADTEEWITLLREKGLFKEPTEHMAAAGDVVFIKDEIQGVLPYIVSDITTDEEKGTVLKLIGANAEGVISQRELEKDSFDIVGYADTATAYAEYRQYVPYEIVYEDKNVTVKASYLLSAGIPEGAVLSVTAIDETDEKYEECYSAAQDKIDKNTPTTKNSSINDFRLYDICLLFDGEEITPLGKVDISISYPSEINESDSVSVVHYAEDGVELSTVNEFYVDENGNLNTEFETGSFSLFAIVTTDSGAKSVITYESFSVTSTNVSQLGGQTFAVAQDAYAIFCEEDGHISSKEIYIRSSGSVTGEESLIQWTFERRGTAGSNYYLKTSFSDNTYYLAVSDGTLITTADKNAATVFTATRSGTNITLSSGTSYVGVTKTSPTVGSSAALTLYSIPSNGSVQVIFDGQFGNPTYMGNGNHSGTYYKWKDAQKITTTTDENGYVTLPASLTTGSTYYPMKVNGWYDIVNGIYYDSSMLGKQIKVTSPTTFYPEWVAETYDIGRNVDVVEGQPDTRDFITTKMFDYNELFNIHSCNYNESDDRWYFDSGSDLGFIFFDYIQPTGNIGYMYDKDDEVDGITINAEKTKGSRGSSITFPGTITAGIATDERINTLFGDDNIVGRLALGEADWLYSYDEETGFYYYNSAKNAASYNQSEQRFYVYDYTVSIDGSGSLNDFIPFNYITDHGDAHANSPANTVVTDDFVYCEKGNQVNYWFGMSSDIEFYLPEDSGSGQNFSAHGEEMQFRFSGDDDVWIFIDGELVLDLGGVHDVVYGEINFSTGIVKTGQAISSSAVANNTADSYAGMPGVESGTPSGVTITELPTLEGGKEHTLTVYYLERGSSLSNCAIYFNLSPAYELQITKSDKQGNKHLENAQFQIFDDPECTIPSTLYVHAENGTLEEITGAVFTTDEHGVINCFGLLAGKTYYIKEVVPPNGYPDMSKFIIEIDLNGEGHPVHVVIDSNKEPWVYADAYVLSNDMSHKIELHVYNDTHIGGSETKKVYVEKTWADGSTNIPEEITVALYANGEETSRTLTLNAENGWKGLFYQLPTYDGDGNEIVYTVKETNAPYGYTVTYREIVGEDSTTVEVPGYFEEVSTLKDGATYHFVVASTGLGIQGTNSTTVNVATDNNTSDAQLWIATKSGNGFLLQNKAFPTRYLSISTSSVTGVTSTGNNTVISLTNGKLKSASNGYLRSSGTSISATRWSSYGSTVTAYEWIPPTTETTTVEVPGWNITNTPWDRLTIPIQKIWDETVTEANKGPLEFELYLVTNGEINSPVKMTSLTLTSENGWSGSFEDLDYPDENGYYCIVEKTETYTVTYGGETVYILIDDTMCEAAVVDIDSFGIAKTVQTTNSVLYLLPDTGGIGSILITLAGLITVIPSGILLAYRYRKKRKEEGSLP